MTCMLSHFSCIQLSVTLRTMACQAPLSMGFSRQEYWSGLPFPSPVSMTGFNLYFLETIHEDLALCGSHSLYLNCDKLYHYNGKASKDNR